MDRSIQVIDQLRAEGDLGKSRNSICLFNDRCSFSVLPVRSEVFHRPGGECDPCSALTQFLFAPPFRQIFAFQID